VLNVRFKNVSVEGAPGELPLFLQLEGRRRRTQRPRRHLREKPTTAPARWRTGQDRLRLGGDGAACTSPWTTNSNRNVCRHLTRHHSPSNLLARRWLGYTETLTRPSDTLSHRMGEGRGEGKAVAHPDDFFSN